MKDAFSMEKPPKPKRAKEPPSPAQATLMAKSHGEIAGIPTSLAVARVNLSDAIRRCDTARASKTLTDSQCERLLAIAAECKAVSETLTNLQREADGLKDATHGMETTAEVELV